MIVNKSLIIASIPLAVSFAAMGCCGVDPATRRGRVVVILVTDRGPSPNTEGGCGACPEKSHDEEPKGRAR